MRQLLVGVALLTACSSVQTDSFVAGRKHDPSIPTPIAAESPGPGVTSTSGDRRKVDRLSAKKKVRQQAPTGKGPSGDFAGTRLSADGNFLVHFIEVGQGDATLRQLPNGTDILVDGGSLKDPDPSASRDYLTNALKDDRIETLVLTHPNADHYNLLPFALSQIAVGQVILVGPALAFLSAIK